MTTRRRNHDEDDDLDPEGPSADDLARFGDEFITCPSCKHSMYDQAELCPHCGHAMESPPARVPIWVMITAVAMLGLLLLAFLP